MKHLLVLLFMASSLFCFGQGKKELKNPSPVIFYGVDFSQVKAFGAEETGEQFKQAFGRINDLFIVEAKKYDVGKILKTDVTETSLDAVNEVNKAINAEELITTEQMYSLDEAQIAKAIKALPVMSDEEKTGLVLLAILLDKADKKGTYQIVFFNTKTKEIISNKSVSGNAGGFGLRNYWAASVRNAIKKAK